MSLNKCSICGKIISKRNKRFCSYECYWKSLIVNKIEILESGEKVKICSKCKKKKSLNNFCKDKRYSTGYGSWCRNCTNRHWAGIPIGIKRKWERSKWKKYRTIPRKRLENSISALLYKSLKGKKAGYRWQDLVGYSIEKLKSHLEKQFKEGMTWDNYGSYWSVDHIKPRSLFVYAKPEDKEFQECWALNNLRPLSCKDNCKKKNKFNPTMV